MTTRSFSNAFEVVDQTQALKIIPNAWTLLGDTGLFKEESLSQNTVTFQEQKGVLNFYGDMVRGSRPQTQLNETRRIHSYVLPHFPTVDAIYPQDVQGKAAYADLNTPDTTDAVLARKMEKIKRGYAVTKELARFKTLTTGAAYAPNGTVVANFYTDFGITRTEVDFVLGTATTDIVGKVESVIADLQDKSQNGEVITSVVAYCSPEFFAALIAHAKVVAAYQYYSATAQQSILRNRAGGMESGLYRQFDYAGVRFIEVRTSFNGSRLIPAKDAYFVAQGVDDAFVTYYGPANRFGYENTIAETEYLWTFKDPRATEITIEGESNFLNVLRKPQLVIRGFTA